MLADWVTDAAIAVQRGPGGLPVHAGFNETWKSFAPALREFLRGRNPSRVHCVGHSLGGALAMLNADFLTSNGVADVALYTFGAPRTGDAIFARSLTARIGSRKVFRVSNPVDPVAMIPLFPFWHLPFDGSGLVIQRTADLPISFAGHSMVKSYVPGVAGKDWSALHDPGTSSLDVAAWLNNAAQGHGSFLAGSARLLGMIASALGWLMKSSIKLALGSINLQLSAGLTVLDQVAWLLSRAAHLSAQIGTQVKVLIGAIFRFLGRKTMEVGDVTVSFLRWLLGLLFNSLRAAAQRALAMLGR
jgi:pimeloyl-ACP methyl ester carboxylesterase